MGKKRMQNKKRIQIYQICLFLGLAVGYLTYFYFVVPLGQDDYFYHIKIGTDILNGTKINTTDIYSWLSTEVSMKWINHEWLAEVIMALLYKLIGHNTIHFMILSGMAGIYICMIKSGAIRGNLLADIPCIILLLFIMLDETARPYVWGNCFIALFVYLLEQIHTKKKTYSPAFIFMIVVVWANIHGGSVIMAILLPLTYLIFGLFTFHTGGYMYQPKAEPKELRQYAKLTVISAAASVVTPFGFRTVTYLFYQDSTVKQFISEWESLDFTMDELRKFWVLPVFVGLFFLSRKRIEIKDFIICAGTIFIFVAQVRYFPIACIFVLMYGYKYCKEDAGFVKKDIVCRILLAGCMISFILSILLLYRINTKSDSIIDPPVSDKMIQILEGLEGERIYTSYNDGSYLIFKGIPVFIDGRADLYDPQMLVRAMLLCYASKEYEQDGVINVKDFINEWQLSYFLLENEHSLTGYLIENYHTYIIYKDKKETLLKIGSYKN